MSVHTSGAHTGMTTIVYAASYIYLKSVYLNLHLLQEPKLGALLIELPCEFCFTSSDSTNNFMYLLKPLAAI